MKDRGGSLGGESLPTDHNYSNKEEEDEEQQL